jgi:ribonuclease VapC
MFVDASALVAILLREVDAERFLDAIATSSPCYTSPLAIYEVVLGSMREARLERSLAEKTARALLEELKIQTVPITAEIGHLALDAFDKYGKGRGHPAQLNMGDCFAYACAKAHGLRLLYKGDDFSRTDLAWTAGR